MTETQNTVDKKRADCLEWEDVKIDNKSNQKLEKFISNYNSNNKKFFNKITFKSFVNKIFVVYFG